MKVIPDRLLPKFCKQCGARMRDRRAEDKFNQFVCSADADHEDWVQSPSSAFAIIVDENDDTYLVERAIPPAIGGTCFPGGYRDFGDTDLETTVHETHDEACITICCHGIYLGQWFEEGPGVTVTGFLVLVHSSRVAPFVKNTEASARFKRSIWDVQESDLVFNGNRLALLAARTKLKVLR